VDIWFWATKGQPSSFGSCLDTFKALSHSLAPTFLLDPRPISAA